jgi:hypothetical protein
MDKKSQTIQAQSRPQHAGAISLMDPLHDDPVSRAKDDPIEQHAFSVK